MKLMIDLIIVSQKKLLNGVGDKFKHAAAQIGSHFNHLQVFLDILSNFGDRLLHEHLDMHKTVCCFPLLTPYFA